MWIEQRRRRGNGWSIAGQRRRLYEQWGVMMRRTWCRGISRRCEDERKDGIVEGEGEVSWDGMDFSVGGDAEQDGYDRQTVKVGVT
jgi:hypothetical protein